MKSKKGVELGVNTMIIVVIALLVLIIIGYLIIKSAGTTNTETKCEGPRGGACRDACNSDEVPSPYSGCSSPTPVCCIKLGS